MAQAFNFNALNSDDAFQRGQNNEKLSEAQRKNNFLENYRKLLNKETHADIVIHLRCPIESSSFPSSTSSDPLSASPTFTLFAHQAICSLHTDYFSSAVKHGFLEAQNSKGAFHFEDYDPKAVLWVMKYIYTGDYDVNIDLYQELILLKHKSDKGEHEEKGKHLSHIEPEGQTGPTTKLTGALIAHSKVYNIADMLLIKDLRELASSRFCDTIHHLQISITQSNDLEDIVDLIDEIWSNHREDLKKPVLELVLWMAGKGGHENIRTLFEKEKYKAVMRQTDFGADLAEKLLYERVMQSALESKKAENPWSHFPDFGKD